jgi:flavorubredoxin
MAAIQIANDIFWTGIIDWNMRTFHGNTYKTNRGTTYNSYVIKDTKIALIDTAYAPFTQEFISHVREVVDPAVIDYIIANHVEPDHSGALPALLALCPKAKVYGSARCKAGLEKYYGLSLNFQVVKTGDTLSLGKRTLQFIEAPMIHWPDSMFTYIVEDQILMPNDAFGQHLASSGRFDDEVDPCVLMDEVSKYYANILWPLGSLIAAKIADIKKTKLPIKMIAPSHGVIWRKNPALVVEAYQRWATNTVKNKVVIFYETMWGSTEKMARVMADACTAAGVETVLYDITKVDRTDITNQLLDAKGFLAGSSTHDNDMLPTIAGFLEFLKGLKPKGRKAAVFGSIGWSGGAAQSIEKVLKEGGVEIVQPALTVTFAPDAAELARCAEFGAAFAAQITA